MSDWEGSHLSPILQFQRTPSYLETQWLNVWMNITNLNYLISSGRQNYPVIIQNCAFPADPLPVGRSEDRAH